MRYLTLADGYYLRHQTEVDAYVRRQAQQAEHVRQDNEARFDPGGVRDRLSVRRSSR